MKRKPNAPASAAAEIAPGDAEIDQVDDAAITANDGTETGRRRRAGEPLARQPVPSRSGAGRTIGQRAAVVEQVDEGATDPGAATVGSGDEAATDDGDPIETAAD